MDRVHADLLEEAFPRNSNIIRPIRLGNLLRDYRRSATCKAVSEYLKVFTDLRCVYNSRQPDFIELPSDLRSEHLQQPDWEREGLYPYSSRVPSLATLRQFPWLVGYELEFMSNMEDSPSSFYSGSGWMPCFDGTCGFEVKSPPIGLKHDSSYGMVIPLEVRRLVRHEDSLFSGCGGHINLSSRLLERAYGTDAYDNFFYAVSPYIEVFLGAMYPRRVAERFCPIHCSQRTASHKYQVVRSRGNRLEFRVFPAHNNTALMKRRLDMCIALILEARACNLRVDARGVPPLEFCVGVLKRWSSGMDRRIPLTRKWVEKFLLRAAVVASVVRPFCYSSIEKLSTSAITLSCERFPFDS